MNVNWDDFNDDIQHIRGESDERKVCPMLLPYCTDSYCIEERCAWWNKYGCVITRMGDAIRSQIECDKLYE